MPYLLNLGYLFALALLSPWLLYKVLTTGKYRRGLLSKSLGCTPPLSPGRRAWFHGVSVGEIHLLRQVVARFRQRHPDWDCVISTTTDTGLEEARKRFPDLPVFYWPLDFSWAVRRALRRVRPDLVVLAESELWPNFLLAAGRQGVPVAVVNGRMSPRSLRRYRRLGPLARWLFARVDLFAMQTAAYADNVCRLGAAPERVQVTGNVKYDGVETDRANPRTQELRRLLNVRADDLVWVAGSTQAPEEEIALDIFRRAQADHPHLRLFLVPRQKERFDEVAALLRRSGIPFVRRSAVRPGAPSPCHPVILVDTIGELGALWGLADVAFVGGSLDGRRGGQNMIEPAAYGAAVVFGPHVWNFRDTAARLVEAGAAIQVPDAAALDTAVRRLLADAAARERLGAAARRLVLQQQGATERTMDLLDELLHSSAGAPRPESAPGIIRARSVSDG
ncbi:MAG TPA: 3-deoxy-D-manno-octulosonic acid transferase [Gemmataceae bacterium]|nr:3-deoxy-D-manno-octulosonic acid transferase [Gemmataceae bacterium]